jgi:hypothetical protein
MCYSARVPKSTWTFLNRRLSNSYHSKSLTKGEKNKMQETPIISQKGRGRGDRARLLMIPVHSLMPLVVILIIMGTLIWGPWVSLALAITLHFIVERTQ